MSMRSRGRNSYPVIKRFVDLIVSVPFALATAPITALMAFLVRRDGGPAFYRANRVGRGGNEFTMLKFRTMVADAESLGSSSTAGDDPRITRVGHWMRKYKFDELPQLINVIRGEMSLVGPRPQVAWDVDRYTADERRLLTVKPGITDWASIRFRNEGEILLGEEDPDEAYDRLIRPEKIKLGLAYIDRMSFKTDLGIMRDTVLAVARHEPLFTPDAPVDKKATPFASITEDWSTHADEQQWALASQRYSLAAALCQGKDFAEIGCGTGYGLAQVAEFAKSAVGLEIDDDNVERARARAPHCVIVKGSAENLPFADNSLDCLAALEMFYYLRDQESFLREAHRVLRRGGTLLVTMPNPSRPAFQPSPFSTTYPTAIELTEMMAAAVFDTSLFGSLPTDRQPPALELLRRTLVRTRLIPRTIAGRARLKAVLHRDMRELSSINVNPVNAFDDIAPLHGPEEPSDFGILIAICTAR